MTADVELLPLPKWAYDNMHLRLRATSLQNRLTVYARAVAEHNVAHATAAKDAEIEALRAEVERAVEVAQEGARLVAKAASQRDAEKARAERLAEAGRRVTAAFRAHGEATPFTREAGRTRHECEAAMLALDDALNPTAAQDNDDANR